MRPYNTYQYKLCRTTCDTHTRCRYPQVYKKTAGNKNMPIGSGSSVPCPHDDALGPKGKVKQDTPPNNPGEKYFWTCFGIARFTRIPPPPVDDRASYLRQGYFRRIAFAIFGGGAPSYASDRAVLSSCGEGQCSKWDTKTASKFKAPGEVLTHRHKSAQDSKNARHLVA